MRTHINPHTKVRRLGYLKLISELFRYRDYQPANILAPLLEKEAGKPEYIQQLRQYREKFRRDNKGVIENTGKGSSAQPYLDLAEDLGFLVVSNYSYILTKYSKVYQAISNHIKLEHKRFKNLTPDPYFRQLNIFYGGEHYINTNIFILNNFDKLFFLRQLLLKDFLYFKSILLAIHYQRYNAEEGRIKVRYGLVKYSLNEILMEQLEHFLKEEPNPYKKHATYEYFRKIKNRNLSIRSYESIVEPRISWLLDLGLIDSEMHMRNTLKLSEAGTRFLDSISNVFDVMHFVENDFIGSFAYSFQLNIKRKKASKTLLNTFLKESFVQFKTLAPNRITASQAINYTCFMTLFIQGIILEYNDVKSYILETEGSIWLVDWYRTENDGSLKKLN